MDVFSNYMVKTIMVVVLFYLYAYMWILLNTSMTVLALPIIILISGILAVIAGYYKISIRFHIDTTNLNLDISHDSTTEDEEGSDAKKTYTYIPVTPQGPYPYKVSPSIMKVLEPLEALELVEPVTPPLDLKPEPNQQHED